MRYRSLRDEMMNFLRHPTPSFSREKTEKFYALKDVSFSVKEGESVGIIGANGAGKSTLLKILSRVTPPTKGEIRLRGRISSLLEVGTGFHPELTGRENIFLNGAVLGMAHKEIRKKFDEIVDFAEVEKFLDTPVKHYSSGMYMRLAFSVAAHLEPEILIVDEVLAVGDAKFQKKCLGRMSDAGNSGRTILFVSHNMAAVGDLCKKAILLDKGKIIQIGQTAKVIATYLSRDYVASRGVVDLTKTFLRKSSLANSAFSFSRLTLLNSKKESTSIIEGDEIFTIHIEGQLRMYIPDLLIALTILSNGTFPIYSSQIKAEEMKLKKTTKNISLTLSMNPNIFSPGIYTLALGAKGRQTVDWIPEVLNFTIQEKEGEKKLESVYDSLVVYPRNWTSHVDRK